MPNDSISVFAPAKVNLFLGVHPEKDDRGYHRVDSVMVPLGLADVVTVTPSGATSVTCVPDAGCPAENNTCWKAVHALTEAVGTSTAFSVRVERSVPNQAGLGGASSDAAAAIVGVCALSGIDPHDPRVAEAARKVGADVPFFLVGGACFLDGAGDVARESLPTPTLADGSPVPVALVRPSGDGVPTPAAYADFDGDPVEVAPVEPMLEALRSGDADAVVANVANNLGPVARRMLPKVDEVLTWLRSSEGVRTAEVSGSGSCCFAICDSGVAAASVADAARGRGWWSCATHLAREGATLLD